MRPILPLVIVVGALCCAAGAGNIHFARAHCLQDRYTENTDTIESVEDELATCKALLDNGTLYLLDTLHQVKLELLQAKSATKNLQAQFVRLADETANYRQRVTALRHENFDLRNRVLQR